MIIEILLTAVVILILINIFIVFKTRVTNSKNLFFDIQKELLNGFEKSSGKVEAQIKDEFLSNRKEQSTNLKENREELSNSINKFQESLLKRMMEIVSFQKTQFEFFSKQLDTLTKSNEKKFTLVSETLEKKLEDLQKSNEQKLEKMRETVDEKLHKTLEDRLGKSFQIVNDQLENVHKGLGEMQKLAIGVGDLKKVLANVKTRGVLGEFQLENILEDLFSPTQYSKNVKTKANSNNFVEFAMKLPGKDDRKPVWIPIDSKFPIEDYQNLTEAYESGNKGEIELFQKKLCTRIQRFAAEIQEKYIDPPNTTDFAIMFLPIEGLYAEVLRNAGLFETIRRKYRVTITGPTSLSAFLSSLQMGFRTLAIEKRSSEVWRLLGAVKTEFGKFGEVLIKTKKKIVEAGNVIDSAGVRTRAIERKLKDVEELPQKDSKQLLPDSIE